MRYLDLPSAIAILICGSLFLMITVVTAAEFPAVEKLTSVKELSDPLLMFNGTRITTVEEWNTRRKPELKALFQHYMYGAMPAAPTISAAIKRLDKDCLGGKATMKQVTISFGAADCPPINLLMFV